MVDLEATMEDVAEKAVEETGVQEEEKDLVVDKVVETETVVVVVLMEDLEAKVVQLVDKVVKEVEEDSLVAVEGMEVMGVPEVYSVVQVDLEEEDLVMVVVVVEKVKVV